LAVNINSIKIWDYWRDFGSGSREFGNDQRLRLGLDAFRARAGWMTPHSLGSEIQAIWQLWRSERTP
jgi:hypothetical protein